MIIKKYQGKTEAEAMEAAKKELGDGVVLMNVKTIKPKGIMRLFKSAVVEITVAKEEESEQQVKATPVKKEDAPPKQEKKPAEPTPEEKILLERLNSLETLLEKQINREEKDESDKKTDNKDEEKTEAVNSEEEDRNREILEMIRTTLVENEMDEKYVDSILKEVEKSIKPGVPMEHILAHVYQRMILRFGKPEPVTAAEKGPKVVFFVGTTGVGKTTTIAKIASKFIVEEKKKVALLTADTYRIAAAEQLRTYANILEVPFRVVYTEDEIGDAIEHFQEFDYILVDTAGHSHHNEDQRDTMAQFVNFTKEKAETEVYLVLSATTKYKDLLSIADSYKELGEYKLIFTKLDETVTYGNLLNLKLYTNASMSYITCGQNVPDDIESFNAQSTVKKLLGGK